MLARTIPWPLTSGVRSEPQVGEGPVEVGRVRKSQYYWCTRASPV